MLTNEVLQKAEDMDYKFQLNCYYSHSKKMKGTLLLWSDTIKDVYWNFATNINTALKDFPNLLHQIDSFYKSIHRQTVIHITPFTKPKNAKDFLFSQPIFRSSWMFYQGSEPKVLLPSGFVIREVTTKEELKMFVDVFNQAYGGATSDEPYGALPKEYGKALLNSKKFHHYIGYFNNQPVAIGSLIYAKGFAGLYNLGVSPKYRKQGFGMLMSLFRVKEALKKKNKVIFLQTEKDSINERIFTKTGFVTHFIGEGFLIRK